MTNHAHVLICLALDPSARIRDMAASIGITERAVQQIVVDLDRAGYIERRRDGRRNKYQVHLDRRLRHEIEAQSRVSDLLMLVKCDGPMVTANE